MASATCEAVDPEGILVKVFAPHNGEIKHFFLSEAPSAHENDEALAVRLEWRQQRDASPLALVQRHLIVTNVMRSLQLRRKSETIASAAVLTIPAGMKRAGFPRQSEVSFSC